MTAEPWVSVEQVAQHLGVAKDTVYRWREHRRLPAHRVGRLWKLKLSEVDDWVRAGAPMKARTENREGLHEHERGGYPLPPHRSSAA